MAPKTYRLAPNLRRSCWYGIAAAPLLGLVVLAVGNPKQGLGPGETVGHAVVLLLLAAPLAVPLTWRLTVDDRGLTRRLLGVGVFWPWEDFASGAIEKRLDGALVHTGRPWWNPRRWLTLPLGAADCLAVLDAINQRYTPPEPPPAPESLKLWMAFTTIELDANGVHTRRWRHGLQTCLWSEVLAIDIRRADAKRADFDRLELVLPDRVLDFRVLRGSAAWRGSAPAELEALLRRYAPADRFGVSFVDGPAPSRAWLERRVAEAEKNAREFGWIVRIGPWVMLGMVIWCGVKEGAAVACGMGLMMVVYPLLPMWWANRSLGKRLAASKTLLENDAWRTTPPPATSL